MRQVSSGMLISIGLLLGAIVLEPRASAQEDGEQEEARRIIGRCAVFMSDQQFDQWFFGRDGGAVKVRLALEADLQERILSNGFSRYLTAEQAKKLELAGMRDIQRFFDGIRGRRRCSTASGRIRAR